MTLTCAVQMLLPGLLKRQAGSGGQTEIRSLQNIVDDIEKASKTQLW
jgi:hypothetical protein